MKHLTFYKLLLILLIGLLIGTSGIFASLFIRNYREYKHLNAREVRQREQLESVQVKIHEHQEYLDCLEHDVEFFEHVAREKTGYSGPNEIIFRFKQPPNINPNHT